MIRTRQPSGGINKSGGTRKTETAPRWRWHTAGFTLIELMIVTAIIGILASVALPAYQDYIVRAELTDALSIASHARIQITDYHKEHLAFPSDNEAAGLPQAQLLIGNRVTGVAVSGGAVHVTLGHKAAAPLQGKVLTLRPAVVTGSPNSPISWLCGYDEAVPGMQAVGANNTDIDPKLLPASCR